MLRSRKGFTLIELIIVIMIIVIVFIIGVSSCGVFMSTKSLQQGQDVEIMTQEEELQQLETIQPKQQETKSTDKGNKNTL